MQQPKQQNLNQPQERILNSTESSRGTRLYRRIFTISLTFVVICIAFAGTYHFEFASNILHPLIVLCFFVIAVAITVISGAVYRAKLMRIANSGDTHLSASITIINSSLNIILLGIIWGLIGAVAFILLLFSIAPSTGSEGTMGYGMLILFIIPILLGICFLCVTYMFIGWFGIVRSRFMHQKIAERHRVVIIPITIISLLTITLSSYNSLIVPALQSYKDSHYTGPTSSQVAAVKMGSFEEVQQRLTDCYVYYINYEQYDADGPLRLNNAYIKVNMQGHIPAHEDNNAYIPDDINLPISDRYRLETAVNDKNKHRDGNYPSCSEEILFDSNLAPMKIKIDVLN